MAAVPFVVLVIALTPVTISLGKIDACSLFAFIKIDACSLLPFGKIGACSLLPFGKIDVCSPAFLDYLKNLQS